MAKNPFPVDDAQQPQPFNLDMSDDALVTFGAPVGPDARAFLDQGYMPVNQFTIGGSLQELKGKLDGLFVHYVGEGVQHFDLTTGLPTMAKYTNLQFELVGYKGDATFGHAADGTPTVGGAKHLTVLAEGEKADFIDGYLGFDKGGIVGNLETSMRVDGQVVGKLAISVQHAAGDVGYTAKGLTLDGGSLQAVFTPLNVG